MDSFRVMYILAFDGVLEETKLSCVMPLRPPDEVAVARLWQRRENRLRFRWARGVRLDDGLSDRRCRRLGRLRRFRGSGLPLGFTLLRTAAVDAGGDRLDGRYRPAGTGALGGGLDGVGGFQRLDSLG